MAGSADGRRSARIGDDGTIYVNETGSATSGNGNDGGHVGGLPTGAIVAMLLFAG